MSKSNYLENAVLGLLYNGTAIPGLAENHSTSPATTLHIALHTADPGEAGAQSTNEVTYTSYARAQVGRNGDDLIVTDSSVSPAGLVSWPQCTGPSDDMTATHWSIGPASSGATPIMHKGLLDPPIRILLNVTPQMTSATITED